MSSTTVNNQPQIIPNSITRAEAIARAKPAPCFKPELRAKILDGSKTQTRRIMKPQPTWENTSHPAMLPGGRCLFGVIAEGGRMEWVSPHGGPGTIWYIREPLKRSDDGNNFIVYADDGEAPTQPVSDPYRPAEDHVIPWRWQRDSLPQIHMPRELARHFVRVTDVRVERVQEISEADADAEGFGGDFPCSAFPDVFQGDWSHLSIPECFGVLWDSIHGKTHPWEANPWVWVYTFELLEVANA